MRLKTQENVLSAVSFHWQGFVSALPDEEMVMLISASRVGSEVAPAG